MSENVMPMAMNRIDVFRFGSVGRPLAGNQLVVSLEGEIKVKGAGLFAGYLGDQNHPSAFDADGYYRTGDIGCINVDGFLTLIGRSGDFIKTSTGRRVAPAGVESLLRQVPGIEHAVVVGNGRKCLVALCTYVGARSTNVARACLVQALREQVRSISEQERPSGIVLINHSFSISTGELTSNLKLKRNVIHFKYEKQINDLYKEIDKQPMHRLEVIFSQ